MPDSSANPIRVLVVDDSAFMRTALRRMIESDPALRVVDTACDGVEGVQKALHLRPDVITMGVEMPRMSGLDALSKIMEAAPCPVIMVSALTRAYADATLEALSRGAYDFLSKDLSYASLDIVRIKDELIAKCKAAVSRKRRPPQPAPVVPPVRIAPHTARRFAAPRLVCIGTSTGGPKALQRILPLLPAIPSVDILMLSAADQFGRHAMGVILTGMGCDGQQGLAAIYRAGGYTLGEDEATCTVYGMPRACAEAGILHRVMGLDAIPAEIVRMVENPASSPAPASSDHSSNSTLSAG